MAVNLRGRATEIGISRREMSPEKKKVWAEPKKSAQRKVPVVYYLCRNGQLEHPHFMEVPISSTDGLYLRDVINRLNLLRGKGIASLYSWSSKRSYKNGYVWQDLSENDFINPVNGHEYVIKGSEILDQSLIHKPIEAAASFRLPRQIESPAIESDLPAISRRRNQSWSSIDFQEYKVYKNESNSESSRRLAADASTQTDDKRRRRKPEKEEENEELEGSQSQQNQSTELSREEISPPPSDSSPETLENLMKAEGRLRLGQPISEDDGFNRTAVGSTSGRMKASTVLMQLISCGSISFKDCGPSSETDQEFSLVGHYKSRLPRGAANSSQVEKVTGPEREIGNFSGIRLEDKEYFSGSLIETKKEEIPALKRSTSYNAERISKIQLEEEEIDGVRAKCIPRKLKTSQIKKDEVGSKRHNI